MKVSYDKTTDTLSTFPSAGSVLDLPPRTNAPRINGQQTILRCGMGRLPIHFVVASDVEEDDFFLGYTKRQGDAVDIREADRVEPFKFSTERM